ncbi:hypothetical protein KQH54_00425 [bacterium]|nr:hypothetical protein [bacterium]
MMKKFAYKRFGGMPLVGWLGIVMVAVFWGLNWGLSGLRTHWVFTPLWVGYSLMMDGFVFKRKKTSLLYRNPKAFLSLYLISVAGWWLFEVFNARLQNWTYIGREYFTQTQYFLLASLSFSTVIPAVFETAELVGSFKWVQSRPLGWRIPVNRQTTAGVFVMGWGMVVLMLVWPRVFFPFMWLSVYFILEPVNVWLGNRTLAEYVDQRDWRPLFALWIGALITGFFWEMWNFYAYPKWVYHVPFVNFAHIFEMPLLGYGGYLPFAMELFALYHLVMGFLGKKADWDYVELLPK